MKSFHFAEGPEPHRDRTKKILKEHPGVRNLIGKNPLSIFAILFMVSTMVVLSYLVKDSAWWAVLLVAYTAGALLNHSLFVMIHECTHNLILKTKAGNHLASIIANLPHVLPSAVSFHRYHLKHHSFQGIRELDGDLPDMWEAKSFGNNFFTKALWLLFFPVFQTIRTFRLKEIKPIDGWVLTNWGAQLVFNILILYFFGLQAMVFLLLSFFFAVGLHPLGARWIQEHFLVLDPNQETYSYYGPLNTVSFNVGYHNEHHDFPSIPWNKLPKLKNSAPEYYDSLKSHPSWTKLWLRFLFDKNISLYSRTIRNDRGKVPITDESTPDTDLIGQKIS